MSYGIALRQLRAYEPRALVALAYRRGDACCAIGVLVPAAQGRAEPIALFAETVPAVRRALRRVGLTPLQAEAIQAINDAFAGSEAARYRHVRAAVARLARR